MAIKNKLAVSEAEPTAESAFDVAAENTSVEQQYRDIIENASDIIFTLDLDGRYTSLNRAGEQIIGYTREEALAMHVSDIVAPEYLDRVRQKLEAKREGSLEPTIYEKEIFTKDKRRLTLEVNSRPIIKNNRVAGVLGIARDITARKEQEKAQAESEQRFQAIFHTANIGIAIGDRNASAAESNQAYQQMLGYTAEELRGMTIRDYTHPEDVELNIALHKELIEGKREFYRMEKRYICKDKRLIWGNLTVSLVRCAAGEPLFGVAMVEDITKRKKAEQSLRESEERFRDLVENAKDIIYTHDLTGRYTSINRAGEEIIGYSLEEVLNLSFADVVAPEQIEFARQRLNDKINGVEQAAYELEIVRKDRRRLTVEVNTRLIYENDEPIGVQGIARDITARKNLEEQLRQAQKLEAVGRLAGGIAHDFNNMLTVITSYSDLLLRNLDSADVNRQKVEEIKRAGERSATLTQQLLAFSRRQIMQPQIVDLNRIVSDMSIMLERLIGEDVQLVARLGADLRAVKVDIGQISQVVMNLAVNARDAMPAGGRLTIETKNLTISAIDNNGSLAPGRYVALFIGDTGIGMSDDIQAHIFEPFFTTKPVGKGTGLGLATVYGIVKQSGGSIAVESKLGRGTIFKIYLPQAGQAADLQRTDYAAQIPGGTETILLVEDEDMVRDLTSEVLESCGYKVIAARNGAEALHALTLENQKIDLLLTDVVMPQMSGRELAERIARLDPEVPVLFTSGYTGETISHHGIFADGAGFIQKPFTPDQLARKVRETLKTSNPFKTDVGDSVI